MMNKTLFMLKSGQAKQFFQQNITYLAQPEGYQLTTRYKQRWINHALDEQLPEQVIILYAQSPYTHVLPVRRAILHKYEIDEEEEDCKYYLTLGPLLSPIHLDESDAFFQQYRPDDNSFVFTAPTPFFDRVNNSPERRWSDLVHHLVSPAFAPTRENPYADAIFSFAHPLSSANGQPIDPQMPLWVGHSYKMTLSVLAPGVSHADLSQVQVQLDYPRLSAIVTPHEELKEGRMTLVIQPQRTLKSNWTTSVFLRSPTNPSGPVYLGLPPMMRLPTMVEPTPPDEEPIQRLQLFEWLATKLTPRDQLRLLDRYLLPRSDGTPPDPHLLLARAVLLKKEGQTSEAVDTLTQIRADRRTDEMIVLLLECAVAAERQLPFSDLLDQLTDWDDGQRVQRIVKAISKLPEEKVLPLAYHLCRLAPIYAHLIWQQIGQTFQKTHNRLALVQFMQGTQPTQPKGYLLLTANELYHYLVRDVNPCRVSDSYLDYVIDAGMGCNSPTGIASFFMEWMKRHLRQANPNEVEVVQQRLDQAVRWLSTGQEEESVIMLMDALKRTGIADMAEKALWLAMGRVDEARWAGDFDRADRWLREARKSVSSIPSENRSAMLSLIKDEDEQIKQTRHHLSQTFAPRYGSDPGMAPILKLYGIECADGFWVDLAEVMNSNEFIARQLIERLDQLQQFAQQTGSTNAKIHSLSALQGNVSRMELSDTSRLIFKKKGRTLCLIALYPNHDAYDAAIKQRWQLMNRIQRG
ncbi:MAG: hypothetical protein ACPGWR_24475 [Ardenticatenaceae bacterium]